jgi:acyl-CoA reductase-like NAD-dependent aldehyde dehydrogenase
MNGILDAAVQVDRFLQGAAVRYCLIGGIALQRWGMPRTTLDVDCTVMTEFGREEAMVAMLLSWLRPRVPDAATFATRSRVLLAVTDQGVGVDVSLGALPFESRMIERSSTWELDASRSLRTCSAEDLIVQKAFAGRDQDWVDIDTISCQTIGIARPTTHPPRTAATERAEGRSGFASSPDTASARALIAKVPRHDNNRHRKTAMLTETYPYYLANRPVPANTALAVTDKYTGAIVTRVAMADPNAIDQAIAAAESAESALRAMPPYARQKVLQHCVDRFTDRSEELAQVLCVEAGKPIKDSRGEVTRLIDTFRIAAEESVRIGGRVMNLEIGPRGRGYRGMYKRVPIGACSFISPFNFPLNLVAHKVAPALAAGCPFVLKPASRTPVGALLIGEVLAETDLPPGSFSILPCRRDGAAQFATDQRLKLLSFTGSPDVGWQLKRDAGKKQVVLELGGNAACVVDAGTDLDDAVARIVFGAFYQSGQSCISVQRVIIHESVYDQMKNKLIEATRALKSGDPHDESTVIGPMISESEAERVERWIQSALRAGGKLLCGGTRQGPVLEAALLEGVPKDQPVCAAEVFGPVAVLSSFTDFSAALDEVNDSVYGLQAGVFTRDIHHMLEAWDRLEVGGVIIGDVPSWRADHMPYGGVKESGLGREGVRFAIEHLTEIRNLVIRIP